MCVCVSSFWCTAWLGRWLQVIWRLVYGLLTAGQTIISTTALILISLFVCSCVAVELIGKDRELLEDSVTGPIVQMCPGMIHHRRRINQFMPTASYFPPVPRLEAKSCVTSRIGSLLCKRM